MFISLPGRLRVITYSLVISLCTALYAADPPLPAGLGGDLADTADLTDAPALPAGLPSGGEAGEAGVAGVAGVAGEDMEPALPAGLPGVGDDIPSEDTVAKNWRQSLNDLGISGFAETRFGMRTRNNPDQHQTSIAEVRLRTNWRHRYKGINFNISGDLLYDDIDSDRGNVNLVTGTGWFDLREAWMSFRPVENIDVKLGRQILTWGTGDLLFVNDMFAKDWRSFFIGRDLEYLKSPSDSLKVSIFSDIANLDLVYSPRFNPSRTITGQRLSYYNMLYGRRVGGNDVMEIERPDDWFRDDEKFLRLYRRIGGYELAAYGYWGHWSTPEGINMHPLYFAGWLWGFPEGIYPDLNVYGASVRGQLGRGIANAELAYYDSRDDPDGRDILIRNSEFRVLSGYEFDLPEVASDFTVGIQYYLESMRHYNRYSRAMEGWGPKADRNRHVLTLRLTKLLMSQNLKLSLFGYYSPSDQDAYLRPLISYKVDDNWSWTLGGNVLVGKDDHTFFGQFAQNSNVFLSLRYSY